MKTTDRNEFEKVNIFGRGVPNEAFAQFFTGESFLNPLTEFGKCPIFLANVTFEPGSRNNWHRHLADQGGGQILICTAGAGWYQEWEQEPRELNPGDVVYIRPGVKHFHGAQKDSWFSHIALECPGENCSNEWLEPVSVEQYQKLDQIDTKQ